MKTKKAILDLFHNNTVTATIKGGICIDEWPDIVAELSQGLVEGEDYRICDQGNFYFLDGSNRFVFKPKVSRVRTGTFTVKSTRYHFNESSGDIKALKVTDNDTLALVMFNGATIEYSLTVT